MRGHSRFKPSRYRAQKMRALQRRCEYLDAERRRLERLLALALRVAVGGTDVRPVTLLEALCDLDGADPGRAAYIDERKAAI